MLLAFLENPVATEDEKPIVLSIGIFLEPVLKFREYLHDLSSGDIAFLIVEDVPLVFMDTKEFHCLNGCLFICLDGQVWVDDGYPFPSNAVGPHIFPVFALHH